MDESKAQDQASAFDDSSAGQSADSSVEATAKPPAAEPERIAKYLSRAGICSRRDAERWIAERRVKVNGVTIDTPVILVTEADRIVVDGNAVEGPDEPRLFRYHKPSGLVTTNRDELGRETIFDQLPQNMPRVMTVGRLDINTEGLLLLTNDGEVARQLELPDTGWTRRYKVRAFGMLTDDHVNALRKGPTIDGIRYAPAKVEIERQQGSNCWLTLTLKEGKNREVKRLLEYCGLKVNRLIRLSYGPFQLGNLEVGAVEEVKRHILKEQIPGFTDRLKGTKASDRKAAADTRARLEETKSSQKTTKPATTRKIKANRPVSDDSRAPWQGGYSAPKDHHQGKDRDDMRQKSRGASRSAPNGTHRDANRDTFRDAPRDTSRAPARDSRRDNRSYGEGDDLPSARSGHYSDSRTERRPSRPYKDRPEGAEGRNSSYRDRDASAPRDRGAEHARPSHGKKLISPYAALKNKSQAQRGADNDRNDRNDRNDGSARSNRSQGQTHDGDRPYRSDSRPTRSRSEGADRPFDRSQDRPRGDSKSGARNGAGEGPRTGRREDEKPARPSSLRSSSPRSSSSRPSSSRPPSRPEGGGRPPRGRRD